MQTKLSAAEVSNIERAVLRQLERDVPKMVKTIVKARVKDIENEAQGILIRNGIKHPKDGDHAHVVWEAFNQLHSKHVDLNPAICHRLARELKQEPSAVIMDLYLWRKFYNI